MELWKGLGEMREENRDMAFCMKCRKKVAMRESRRVSTKNGRIMKKGFCSECGAKVNRFLSLIEMEQD